MISIGRAQYMYLVATLLYRPKVLFEIQPSKVRLRMKSSKQASPIYALKLMLTYILQ